MRTFSASSVLLLLVSLLTPYPACSATTESLKGGTPPVRLQETPKPEVLHTQTLGDFLTTRTPMQTPHIPGFFSEIPPALEPAVRRLAEDNHSSATAELLAQLAITEDKRARARVLMWLGIALGQQAIDYPTMGWTSGTSATEYLKQAIELDAEVYRAPDAARVLAEMLANGWAGEDPTDALTRYEKKAEQTRDAVDFYVAGIISRRLSAKAWTYSDTTEQDKRTLMNLSRAVAREPGRYETWTVYLRALMPVGLHDLATTEAYKMYDHFKALRTPLLADQGPAMLLLSTSSFRTMQQDQALLDGLERQYPDRPFAPFEKAMRAIETTAPEALVLFPNFIQKVKDGVIKLEPREQGYLSSAYYKLAFLKQQFDDLPGSLQDYLTVKEISPTYAEVNMNLAVIKGQMSEQETTGPLKAQLLREAIQHAAEQERHDFRGRSALKAQELRLKLRQMLRDVEKAMSASGSETTTGTVSRAENTTSPVAAVGAR